MNDLTSKEQLSLARNEHVIETGLFYFFEVGSALLAIRDSKLYRGTHATFEAYCSDMWGMSKPRAYQLIDAAKVKDNLLSTSVDLPATESQTRPLCSLPPDQQASAWQKAVDTVPDGKVTAAHVQKVVKEMMDLALPIAPAPELTPTPTQESIPLTARQRMTPSDAMLFASYAISQLERIHPDDPKMEAAFCRVEHWIQKYITASKQKKTARIVKARISPQELVDDSFQQAFEQMYAQLKNAIAMGWEDTSHKAAVEMMHTLLAITGQSGN